MDLKLKVTSLLAMFLFISLEVAARNLKEGEVVRETNKVGGGDAKLVDGIHDVSKLSIPGIGGSFIGGFVPSMGGGYNIGGIIPDTGGGIFPGIGGGNIGGGIFPGIGGGIFPGIGGGIFPSIVGGFPGINGGGGLPEQVFCRFSCCVQNAQGRCLRCCTVSK